MTKYEKAGLLFMLFAIISSINTPGDNFVIETMVLVVWVTGVAFFVFGGD